MANCSVITQRISDLLIFQNLFVDTFPFRTLVTVVAMTSALIVFVLV